MAEAKPYDPINLLTIAELDSGSRLLRADIVGAVHNGTEARWQGMAILAFLLARRDDPSAKVSMFRAMLPAELTAALGYDATPVAGPVVYVERPRLAAAAFELGVDRAALCAALDVPEPTEIEDAEDAEAAAQVVDPVESAPVDPAAVEGVPVPTTPTPALK